MMRAFEIDIQRTEALPPDSPVGIAIRSGETVFTRLLRPGANDAEEYLRAPPGQLAFWLVDNWWRIRAECVAPSGPTPEWRLAHELASIGGHAWPRLAIWGEGDRAGFLSRSDPAGVVGPVRYLTDALLYVSAEVFEAETDAFLDLVSSKDSALTSDWAALRTQIDGLAAERADADLSAWRRLEAQLGYDVDEAPEALINALHRLALKYGAGGVAEAALATQGDNAATVLEAEIEVANDNHWECSLRRTAELVGRIESQQDAAARQIGMSMTPWRLGENAAAGVRAALGYSTGPLWNRTLGEVLGVRDRAFETVHGARQLAYGLRMNRKNRDLVAPSSRWSHDRRFEFARALGDVIWSRGERLGPLTRAKSERQKFQRAFAQSLLCPYEALQEYIGEDTSEGALSAAAKHFHVSERLIRTLLVNKRTLDRHRLEDFVSGSALPAYESASAQFDAVLDAA